MACIIPIYEIAMPDENPKTSKLTCGHENKDGKSFAEWVFHLLLPNAPFLIVAFCFFRALLVKSFQNIAT